MPVDHLTALGVLADHFREQDLDNTAAVSDLGNAKDATQFSRLLGLPVAAGSKRRLGDDTVVIDSIVGDVEGKRAIVLDDEIATGGLIIELLDRLADHGVTEVAVATTARPVRRPGRRTAARSRDDHRGRHHRHGARSQGLAGAPGALGGRAVRRGHQAHPHEGESVSSLFDGVDPTHAPPRQSTLLDRAGS